MKQIQTDEQAEHLASALAGDQGSFEKLVEPYRREILVHSYRILGSFEDAEDKSRALREIKQLPQIDRVLSHGGTDELNLRIQRLAQYDKAAAPELTIIAGGGIDGDAIIKIGRETQIREFHVGRAARAQFQVGGDVQSGLVATLVKKLNEI